MHSNVRITYILVLLKYYFIVVSGVDLIRQFYTAAVVEYYRTIEYDQDIINAEETLNKNTEYYLTILKNVLEKITETGKEPLDIIVYPESTLYAGFTNEDFLQFGTLVPLPDNKEAPCDNGDTYRKFLSVLSCAARSNSTYMVVNVIEAEPCTEQQVHDQSCASHGSNLYNTNVVFDKEGVVVAKYVATSKIYRKYNLFKEPLNKTEHAETVTFQTDFGVTFGTFTCFDILFQNPALELVKQGVKHFIFPSMWFSELPFLVSVQGQEMWARENDAVLLASGALNPDIGSGGSGIYQGSYGALENILTAEKANQHFLVQEVPKTWLPKRGLPQDYKPSTATYHETIISLDNFKLIWDDNTAYSSVLLNEHNEEDSQTVCSTATGFEDGDIPEGEPRQFCCDFIVLTEANQTPLKANSDFYYYRMFAYSGVRSFTGAYNGGLEVCGLVACTDGKNKTTCGKRFPDASNIIWPRTFTTIIVQANFTRSAKRAQFPNSLKWNLKSIPAMETEWETAHYDTYVHRTHKSLAKQTELLTFGIYGRDFARDSDPNSAVDRVRHHVFVTLVVVVVAVLLTVVVNFH